MTLSLLQVLKLSLLAGFVVGTLWISVSFIHDYGTSEQHKKTFIDRSKSFGKAFLFGTSVVLFANLIVQVAIPWALR